MTMQLGNVTFERPVKPIMHKDVEHILAVGGKDVVRIAWESLAPFTCKHYNSKRACGLGPFKEPMPIHCTNLIVKRDLAAWMAQFFNLQRNEGQGNLCVQQLADNGLLRLIRCVETFNLITDNTYYAWECSPTFKI